MGGKGPSNPCNSLLLQKARVCLYFLQQINQYQVRTCTISKRLLRGVRLSIALKEEAHTLLVRSVGVEPRHHHDLPRQIANEARRAEHGLTQPVEALHCKLKCGFWSPARICNTHTHQGLKHFTSFTPKWPTSCTMSMFRVVEYGQQQNHPLPRETVNYLITDISIFSFWKTLQLHSGKHGTAKHIPFVHYFLQCFFRICYHSSFF